MAEPFIFKMKSSKNTPVQGRRKRPIDSIMDGTTAWDGVQLMKSMKIIAAWIQVTVVLLLVGYGTWQLFEGHFQESFATLPVLFAYYIFVVARQRNRRNHSMEDP